MMDGTKLKSVFYWLIFIIVIILAGLLFLKISKYNITKPNNPTPIMNATSTDLLASLKIKIPENESLFVELKKKAISGGTKRYIAEFNQPILGEDYPIRGSVVLIDEVKFENDKYIVMPMAANFGGSGEFIYLVLLEKTSEGLRHLESLPVGDRISSTSFESKGSQITFNYKSHHDTQAMVEEPFVLTHLNFEIVNGKFVEGIKYFNTNSNDIVLESPKPNSKISSNFDVNFKAKGWLFENSSLAKLISEDYTQIDESQATSLDENWMTPDLVSIKTRLDIGEYKGRAKVILMADNPSGMPKSDKKVEFWVNIE